MRVAPLVIVTAIAFLASGARGAGQAAPPEIVFSSTRGDGDLVVVRADGTHRRVLTRSARNDWSPAWSPDGVHIAFTEFDWPQAWIDVLDLRTGRVRRLGDGSNPDWSPDGRRLVFVTPGSSPDLATMNANGTDTRLLGVRGFGVQSETRPAWAPRGSRIAFIGRHGLFLVNADGTDPQRLRPEGTEGGAAWSPSGEQIAYDCATDYASVCLVRPDGSAFQALTTKGHRPSWSPRGDLIAMSNYTHATTILVRRNGTLVRELPGKLDYVSDWSPDGRSLILSHEVGSGSRLYATDSTGSRLARVTHGYLTDDSAPAWSPDGRWIAFRRQLQAHCSMDVLNVRTGRLRQLDRRRLGEHCRDRPDWSPDGTRILYAMTGSLWVVPRSGGRPQRVRGVGGAASAPRWAPGGRSIAFVSPRGIWLLGRLGRRRLLVRDGGPFAWSHDGRTLAYVALESPGGPRSLFLRRGVQAARRLLQNAEGAPSWSPHDDRIALLQADPELRGWSLVVTDLTGNVRKIFGDDPSGPDWRR